MTGSDLPVPSETERAAARHQSELSMLRCHTGILGAANARLKAERDQLSSMLRAMARRVAEQRAEAASETRWAGRYFTDWQEARAEVVELRRAAADEPSRAGQETGLGGPRRVDDLDVAEAMLINLRDESAGQGVAIGQCESAGHSGDDSVSAGQVWPSAGLDPEAIDRAARLMCDRYDANRLTWATADEKGRQHWRRVARAVAAELGLPAPEKETDDE